MVFSLSLLLSHYGMTPGRMGSTGYHADFTGAKNTNVSVGTHSTIL